jgi:hypothetical protein
MIQTFRHRLTLTAHAAADWLRMFQWVALAIALYVVTFDLGLQESHPGLQATVYTLANITIRGWLGYWLARTALGRLSATAHPNEIMARAIIIAGVVLTSR